MPIFIEKHERRFHRLLNFLKPYRRIEAKLKSSLDKAFKLESSTKESSKILLHVSPLILQKNSPEWVEPTLLRLAVEKSKSTQIDFESEQLKEKLENIYVQEKKAQEEKQKALAESYQLPDIISIWRKLRSEYFPAREDIDDYKVVWSKRKQTSCLASCSIQNRRVLVAEAMQDPESIPFIEPLIYHEMCHAILGEPKIVKGRRIMHGKEFKALERRHPGIKALNAWIKEGGWTKAVERTEALKKAA